MKKNTIREFWENVKVSGIDDCWNWVASKTHNGYGRFKLDGKTRRSHRVAYSVTHGEIQKENFVLHKCDNPACCNPSHLRQGTPKDNMMDKINRGRAVYAVGENVGGAMLDYDKVLSIRNDGRFQKDIAKEHGVSQATISRAKAKASWRHV